MVGIQAAREAARKAIESTYEGTCTIMEYQDVTDPESSITRQKEIVVLERQPCRLSFEQVKAVNQTDTAAAAIQGTKLFLSPEIQVKAGSKLVVEQDGRIREYSSSGEPAVYPSHQEIMLELFRGWA